MLDELEAFLVVLRPIPYKLRGNVAFVPNDLKRPFFARILDVCCSFFSS